MNGNREPKVLCIIAPSRYADRIESHFTNRGARIAGWAVHNRVYIVQTEETASELWEGFRRHIKIKPKECFLILPFSRGYAGEWKEYSRLDECFDQEQARLDNNDHLDREVAR